MLHPHFAVFHFEHLWWIHLSIVCAKCPLGLSDMICFDTLQILSKSNKNVEKQKRLSDQYRWSDRWNDGQGSVECLSIDYGMNTETM
jgi:hypothetical protein